MPASPQQTAIDVWTQPAALPRHLEVDLGLGDELVGGVLSLPPLQPDGGYRVFVQFETSMAIDGEGPHIDLVDWKHCRSEWRMAQAVAANEFRLPVPSDADHSCFPAATRAELRQALQQALAGHAFDPARQQRWLDLAEQAPRLGELPTYVAISTIRVRIEQRSGAQWRVLSTIDFSVPMGC